MTLRDTVDKAIESITITDSDAAAVALARRYADAIDYSEQRMGDPEYEGGDGLKDYGPKLLHALDALGLTPKARAAAAKAQGGGKADDTPTDGGNPYDEIRRRREQRNAAR